MALLREMQWDKNHKLWVKVDARKFSKREAERVKKTVSARKNKQRIRKEGVKMKGGKNE